MWTDLITVSLLHSEMNVKKNRKKKTADDVHSYTICVKLSPVFLNRIYMMYNAIITN